MIANQVTVRRKYNCNLDYKIAITKIAITKIAITKLQSPIQRGSYTIAIRFHKDQIWWQCRKSPNSHVTMIFSRMSSKQNFYDCNHIWSLFEMIAIISSSFLWPRMQWYMVPMILSRSYLIQPYTAMIATIIEAITASKNFQYLKNFLKRKFCNYGNGKNIYVISDKNHLTNQN